MSDNNKDTMEAMRADINKLAASLEAVVKKLEDGKEKEHENIADKLAHELEQLRDYAAGKTGKACDVCQTGIAEVGEQVRRNPLMSLAVAFCAGYVISCFFRR